MTAQEEKELLLLAAIEQMSEEHPNIIYMTKNERDRYALLLGKQVCKDLNKALTQPA